MTDERAEPGERGGDSGSQRTLRAMGITMAGIVLSVATTVAFGLTAPAWVRVGAGIAVAAVLVLAIKLGTAQGGRGWIARAADWMAGSR